MSRLEKIAKVLCTLFTLVFYCYCIGLLFIVFMFLSGYFAPDINIINAQLDGGTLLMFFSGLLSSIVLRIASSVFLDTSKGKSPFNMKQVKRIRIAALVLLLKALLQTVLSESFISLMTLDRFQFGYVTPIIEKGVIPIDGGGLVWAIIFLCLSFVFEYGTKLQQQSDDTF